jgi:hypothetical protein
MSAVGKLGCIGAPDVECHLQWSAVSIFIIALIFGKNGQSDKGIY